MGFPATLPYTLPLEGSPPDVGPPTVRFINTGVWNFAFPGITDFPSGSDRSLPLSQLAIDTYENDFSRCANIGCGVSVGGTFVVGTEYATTDITTLSTTHVVILDIGASDVTVHLPDVTLLAQDFRLFIYNQSTNGGKAIASAHAGSTILGGATTNVVGNHTILRVKLKSTDWVAA